MTMFLMGKWRMWKMVRTYYWTKRNVGYIYYFQDNTIEH